MKDTTFMVLSRAIFAYIIVFTVASILALLLVDTVQSSQFLDTRMDGFSRGLLNRVMPLFSFCIYIVFAILYVKIIEKRPAVTMGFVKRGMFLSYLKGFLVGFGLLSIVLGMGVLTGALTYQGVSQNINWWVIALFLFAYVIQGMGEEVIIRGYFMTTLLERTAMIVAILISSLAFTLPHLPALLAGSDLLMALGFFNTFLFSVLVSLIMIHYKNIWGISALHSAWNFFLGIVFGLTVSGGRNSTGLLNFTATNRMPLLNGGAYGVEASLTTTVVLGTCILVMASRMKRKHALFFKGRTSISS